MVSVLVGKGLCTLGLHSVNLWEYRQEGVCTQNGVCKRCGAERDRTEHAFYIPHYDMEGRRMGSTPGDTCLRCNEPAPREWRP